jgi:hypothetical protein
MVLMNWTRVAMVCAFAALLGRAGLTASVLPSIGQSIVVSDMRVTLLDARRLSRDGYRDATGEAPLEWAGGGLRFAFLIENRPGAQSAPVLGEVRVLFGAQLYNPVTNATSQKPFAPDVIIRTVDAFYATRYGREVRVRSVTPRPNTVANVLEVFVRGKPIPVGAGGVVELEQGETHRQDASGRLQALGANAVPYQWFRFGLPPLD